jgi:hypothetical protein
VVTLQEKRDIATDILQRVNSNRLRYTIYWQFVTATASLQEKGDLVAGIWRRENSNRRRFPLNRLLQTAAA